MRHYETMLIVDAQLGDADVEKALSGFTSLVTDRGGEIKNTDRWGRRRFAHEVDGQWEGFYAVITYQIDPGKVQEVGKGIPFVEGVVRAKTVRPEARSRKG